MSKQTAADVFEIISLVLYIFTLTPQALLNYRLKNTDNLSIITVVLWIIGAEVSLSYLVWTQQLIYISIAYGIFAGTALFIVCQIIYYGKASSKRKIRRRLEFVANYILLLSWSVINGLAFYYIFELSQSHVWISQTIGIIIPGVIDSLGFIPQIILVIRMKSVHGYSLIFMLTDLSSALTGIISICLQENIDIVPLISFALLFLFQSVLLILKVLIFPGKQSTRTSETLFEKSSGQSFDPKEACDENNNSGGLVLVAHRYEREKEIQFPNPDLSRMPCHQLLTDELKQSFKDDFDAVHVQADKSDQCIAREFIAKMANDEPFYIADVSHCPKQYLKWKHYLPNIDVYYAVKTNGNRFIVQMMEKMGSGFDCASANELEQVLSICPGLDCSKRIIYSHPCKPISHIKYFHANQVRLTVVDNIPELMKIHQYWPNAKLLLRLKTDDSKSLIAFSTKFGLNTVMAKKVLAEGRRLQLDMVGCAFHVGTGSYDPTAFKTALRFARTIFDVAKEYDFDFHVLNIGGGFPGVDQNDKPSFAQVADTIQAAVQEYFATYQELNIIAEPGRYFAAGSMDLVASIIATRHDNPEYLIENQSTDGITEDIYYINDGPFQSLANIVYEKATYSISCLRINSEVETEDHETTNPSSVYGPTCDSSDCVAKIVDLPKLSTGDYLVIYNVGAYSASCATDFNGFRTKKYFYISKD